MRTIVTFGQNHLHVIANKLLDKDCLAIFPCEDYADGRKIAFELFDDKFCTSYTESEFKISQFEHFPKGLIELNPTYIKEEKKLCTNFELDLVTKYHEDTIKIAFNLGAFSANIIHKTADSSVIKLSVKTEEIGNNIINKLYTPETLNKFYMSLEE